MSVERKNQTNDSRGNDEKTRGENETNDKLFPEWNIKLVKHWKWDGEQHGIGEDVQNCSTDEVVGSERALPWSNWDDLPVHLDRVTTKGDDEHICNVSGADDPEEVLDHHRVPRVESNALVEEQHGELEGVDERDVGVPGGEFVFRSDGQTMDVGGCE